MSNKPVVFIELIGNTGLIHGAACDVAAKAFCAVAPPHVSLTEEDVHVVECPAVSARSGCAVRVTFTSDHTFAFREDKFEKKLHEAYIVGAYLV